jgi:metallophosphoesterase (TIGR00282 family)
MEEEKKTADRQGLRSPLSASSSPLRVIMIGDVVGEPGLLALETRLPKLIQENAPDFVTANGENAADGFGLTRETLERLLNAGVDVVTSGNHVWEKRDFWPVMDKETRVLRPANYPAGTVGRGWIRIEKAGKAGTGVSWVVINLQGRELMTPIDCPFKTFDALTETMFPAASPALPSELPSEPRPIVLVDFHAESTREKESLGYYLDGRASLVAGTHTHVQTADERILPRGSAYITDLGMTGVQDGIIGMDVKICLDRAKTQVAYRMECAKAGPDGRSTGIRGIIAEIDGNTGKAISIRRLA